MHKPLHVHMLALEDTLQALRERITSAHLSPVQLESVENKIRLASCALNYYRQAFEIEGKLRADDDLKTFQ